MPTMPPKPKTPITTDELTRISRELTRAARSLEVAVSLIRDDKIERLAVTNHDMIVRGMSYLEKFSSAVRQGHLEAMSDQGMYGVTSRVSQPKDDE